MQTFLPFPDFAETARVLDDRRLNNQINEALVILRTLTGWYERRGQRGWPHHPTVQMWQGHETYLLIYAAALLHERARRTGQPFEQERYNRFCEACHSLPIRQWLDGFIRPPWLGDPTLHASHRAALLAKDPGWYGQFGWVEEPEPKIEYHWPELESCVTLKEPL